MNTNVVAVYEENGVETRYVLDYAYELEEFFRGVEDVEVQYFIQSDLDHDDEVIQAEDLEDFLTLADEFNDLNETEQVAVDFLMREGFQSFSTAMDNYVNVDVFEGSLGDAAREWVEEYEEVPRHILPYVDFDAYAEELDFYEYDRHYVIRNPNSC